MYHFFLGPGNVTRVKVNVTGNVVMVSWDPLPEDHWNGLPLGYYVCNSYSDNVLL